MNKFIIPTNMNHSGVKTIFTTRMDGDRKDPLKGFNLSFINGVSEGSCGEQKSIIENRSYLASFLGVNLDSLVIPVQRHTDKVWIISETSIQSPIEADAIITSMRGIVLGVLVADCVPILIYDPDSGVISAIHAGWRGTASGIIKKVLDIMNKKFNTSISKTIISIGPSIRWCCYEVDPDVLKAVEKETGNLKEYSKGKDNGKYYIDLALANQIQAVSLGASNIWISEECTHCNPERFYSYRYYKGVTGRQGGFIGII
ncbi:MAG: peptidoglycan editing factor PgeF [Nitrospirota bacterium]